MADGVMTANEIEFLSEEEEVKIIPIFSMAVLRMIGVSIQIDCFSLSDPNPPTSVAA